MKNSQGFALMVTLLIVVVLSLLALSYFTLTNVDVTTTKAKADQTSGFYAAEAGLNIRGDQIRDVFEMGQFPSGASPTTSCRTGGSGSGDFACDINTVNGRTVDTYVVNQSPPGGNLIRINANEIFGGLNAVEYRYSVFSEAYPPTEVALGNIARPEAILEMVFRSRLVPLFQFAAFYDKDLEILPGPNMTLGGPVHVNGDLYTNANSTLLITGQVTLSENEIQPSGGDGDFYRGRKDSNSCGGTVRIADNNAATTPEPSVNCVGGNRTLLAQTTLDAWGGTIVTGLETVDVPDVSDFNVGGDFWDDSDLRIVRVPLPPFFEVRDQANLPNAILTGLLQACGAVTFPINFPNQREGDMITLMDIDVNLLLNCIGLNPLLLQFGPAGPAVGLADSTDGGLGIYVSAEGPGATGPSSNFGIRLRNGANISAATDGLTFVSDQALYVQGNYNSFLNTDPNWRPAAFMADSLNVLSSAWADNPAITIGGCNSTRRPNAANTTINAAFLAGTDDTGNIDGPGGQGGAYNGGLENYPRFHENWGGDTLTYNGSFVSLGRAQRVGGSWGSQCYSPPARDWGFENNFNNALLLPPLTPNFVYLRQDLFVRDFER